MVNSNNGQLYTIEGITASLILLATVYFVVGGTTVYSLGDTHVNDLQLEVLGNDILLVLDTPPVFNSSAVSKYEKEKTPLEEWVQKDDSTAFDSNFTTLLKRTSIASIPGGLDQRLNYTAIIWYDNGTQKFFSGVRFEDKMKGNTVSVSRLIRYGATRFAAFEVRIWRD